MLNDSILTKRFGDVTVVIEQERETLARILKVPTLRELVIVITIPNPDDAGSFEARMRKNLKGQGVRKQTTILAGPKLKPNEETIKLAKAALSNGSVVARGLDHENLLTKVSSINHPRIDVDLYDTQEISEDDAFRNQAQKSMAKTEPDESQEK